MIRVFEAWENIYDAVVEACSQDSIRCCTFVINLANQINQIIACEKVLNDILNLFIHKTKFIRFVKSLNTTVRSEIMFIYILQHLFGILCSLFFAS